MSRFIESICIKDGEIRNLTFHQARMNRSRYKILGIDGGINLEEFILSHQIPQNGKHKFRIVYDEKIESIEFIPYKIRTINSVKLIEDNQIEYPHKFLDRIQFELLSDNVSEDEILIVKNGKITDTSYSNIVFFDGENWITPSTFLLNGTMRQYLLKSNQIIEKEIDENDLNKFISFKLINAMMNLEESHELDISIIR
ncbi:aminotransferase class IV [Moheibacter sediminis]|uniref:4-amino-4-deoxychorismate lyase n=1 Tax=Moheibacter sediminis TaxID=1434700 RepID=A0A1W2BBN1_9FLAO|nr:aminotransferase class IV [Moheibacter sediminis]SMC70433.1 4-amino-4-deoxychorismate lyase [Moheibacter sediminis]